MGQAGSTEQKIAIRDVVNIKPGAHGKAEKDAMRQALQTFCTMFPLEVGLQSCLHSIACALLGCLLCYLVFGAATREFRGSEWRGGVGCQRAQAV